MHVCVVLNRKGQHCLLFTGLFLWIGQKVSSLIACSSAVKTSAGLDGSFVGLDGSFVGLDGSFVDLNGSFAGLGGIFAGINCSFSGLDGSFLLKAIRTLDLPPSLSIFVTLLSLWLTVLFPPHEQEQQHEQSMSAIENKQMLVLTLKVKVDYQSKDVLTVLCIWLYTKSSDSWKTPIKEWDNLIIKLNSVLKEQNM